MNANRPPGYFFIREICVNLRPIPFLGERDA